MIWYYGIIKLQHVVFNVDLGHLLMVDNKLLNTSSRGKRDIDKEQRMQIAYLHENEMKGKIAGARPVDDSYRFYQSPKKQAWLKRQEAGSSRLWP